MPNTSEPCGSVVSRGSGSRRFRRTYDVAEDRLEELGIDLMRSWMVGDRWCDIDCGYAAGCRTVFIDHEYEEALKLVS